MSGRSSARLREKELRAAEIKPKATTHGAPHSRTSRKKQKTAAETSAPHAKPQVSWARVKGRRGHLKMVVEMPLDIILEILQYLYPVDLLNMSRSNRAMRALLLDRSLTFRVWESAFSSFSPPPPPCPDDLNFPQYANLLFGDTCFECDAKKRLTTSMKCYVRYCESCIETEFISLTHVDQETVKLLRRVTLSDHVKRYDQQSKRRWQTTLFLRRDYEIKLQEVELVLSDKSKRAEYEKRAQERLTKRASFGYHARQWEWALSNAKRRNAADIQSTRQDMIVGKLRGLGYGDVLDRLRYSYRAIATLPGITGKKPLTDKEWDRIRPLLVDTLIELRKTYENDQRKLLLDKRTLTVSGVFDYYISHNRHTERTAPLNQQLARLEPFRTLVYDTPAEKELTATEVMEHLDDIPGALKAWKEDADSLLLALLPSVSPRGRKKGKAASSGKGKEPDLSVLERATSLFSCQWCTEVLVYPAVLSHPCLFHKHARSAAKQSQPAGEEDDIPVDGPGAPWNEGGDQVQFDEEASATATVIIAALGHDPNVVTWEELDKANQRIECLRCRSKKGAAPRLVMGWRSAILHEFAKHSGDEDNGSRAWEVVDADSLAKAYKKEDVSRSWKQVNQVKKLGPYCVECAKITFAGGNFRAPYNTSRYGKRLEGDLKECSKGHDLSVSGTFMELNWTFKGLNPVRID
ncbi:hypothetical protein DFP72DRAFT_873535, partial [Ephemerocybe angulata]